MRKVDGVVWGSICVVEGKVMMVMVMVRAVAFGFWMICEKSGTYCT